MDCILKDDHYWEINKITQDEYYTQRIYDILDKRPTMSEAKAMFLELQKRESPTVAKDRIDRTFNANAQRFINKQSMVKAIPLVGSYNRMHGLQILKIQKLPSGDFFVRIDHNEVKKMPERPLIKNKYINLSEVTKDSRNPSGYIKSGVSELFESNPELAAIGTPQQYSQYLDTIFPDSKVKDIVYHGINSIDLDEEIGGLLEHYEEDWDIYFSPTKKEAEMWAMRSGKSPQPGDVAEIFPAILNNPEFNDDVDGLIIGGKSIGGLTEYVASKRDVHLLGSKQDIEGFKRWTKSNPKTQSMRTRATRSETAEIKEAVTSYLESFGFSIEEKDRLLEYSGNSVEGVVDLLNKTIQYVRTPNRVDVVPEVFGHAIITLAGAKNELVRTLYRDIQNWEGHQTELDKIKDLPEYRGKPVKQKLHISGVLVARELNKKENRKGIVDRIIEFVKKLFAKKLFVSEHAAAKIAKAVLAGDTGLISAAKKEHPLLNYEEALSKNPRAKELIEIFEDLGGILTGSIAIAKNRNSIYRSSEDPVHDLDFKISLKDFNEKALTKVKELGGISAHSGINADTYETRSFYVPNNGYKVRYTKATAHRAIEIEVLDSDGNVVETAKSKGRSMPLPSSKYATYVDFFVYADGLPSNAGSSVDVFQGKAFITTGEFTHYGFSRDKDLNDYKNFDGHTDSVVDSFLYVSPAEKENVKLQKAATTGYNPVAKEENLMLAQDFQDQVNMLTAKFKEKGFDVKVIVDGDLPSGISGQLLGTTDPRYNALVKSGTILKGEAVILVNPRELFNDTVIHEFSHLYIDLLGGEKDPTVALAINELKGTRLWEEVAEAYPELSGAALGKEVLATAMGREGAEIFKSEQKKSRFLRLLDLIFDKIRRMFGLRRSAVKSLAMEMIQGELQIQESGEMDSKTQSRKVIEPKEVRKKYNDIDTESALFEKFKKETTQLLIRKKATLQDRIAKINKDLNPKSHALLTGFKDSVDEIIQHIDELAIVSALTKLQEIVNRNAKYLNTINDKGEFSDPNNLKKGILSELSNIDETLISVQEMLENIRFVVNKSKDIANAEKRSSPVFDAVIAAANAEKGAISVHTVLEKVHNTRLLRDNMRNEIIARSLVAHIPTHLEAVKVREREKFIRENMKKYPSRKEREEAAMKHVNDYLVEHAKEIEATALKKAYALIDMGLIDMKDNEKMFLDPASFGDPFIRLAMKEIENAEFDIRRKHIEHLATIEAIEKKVRDLYGNRVAKDNVFLPFFEDEVDEAGNKTGKKSFILLSEYDSTPFKRLESLKKTLSLAALNDPNNTAGELAKAEKEFNDYMEKNFIVTKDAHGNIDTMLVKDKWKSKAYAALSAQEKALLDEIKDFFDLTDTLKPPNARIRKTFGRKTGGYGIIDARHSAFKTKRAGKDEKREGVGFYTVPSVRRTAAQGLLNLGPKEAIKSALADLGGKSAEDELAYSYAKQNEAGEFLKDIPIYFRGEIEEAQRSRNITQLMNLEMWSSLNYHEKAKIEPFLQLVDEVLSERRVAKLDGVSMKVVYDKLIRIQNYNRAENDQLEDQQQTMSGTESNIYKAFVRLVDDRIYGQHKLGSEKAHKVVDAINSWTSKTNLAWNYFSGAVQFTQGNLMNAMMAKHSKFIDNNTLLRAQMQYLTRGMSSMISDHGLVRARSYDGRLMERFNVFQNFSPFAFDFNKAFRITDTPGAVTGATQHPVETELAYTLAMSVMKSRKLRNKDGKYIKKLGVDGKASEFTDNKDEALGLDAAYVNEAAGLKAHPDVYNTDFNDAPLSQQEFEIERVIHNIQRDAHGNFGTQNREEYKAHFFWRLVMNMRGWIPRTVNKRFKNIDKVSYAAFKNKTFSELVEEGVIHYDDAQKEFSEGTYITGYRFIKDFLKMWKTHTLKDSIETTFAVMTPEQQRNLIMLRNELLIIVGLFAMTMMLAAGVDDDDDKARMFAAYVLSRVRSEMMFYMNPLTTVEILRNPLASLSTIKKVENFASQLLEDTWNFEFEEYDRGIRKGKRKIGKYAGDLFPMFNSGNAFISEYYNYQVGLTAEDF